MKRLIYLAIVLVSGCASAQDYTLYLNSQVQIETARHAADAEKYKALAAIAQSGSDTAKVAAVMSLAVGQLPANGINLKPPSNEALQWAAILVPGLTNIVGTVYGARVGMNASNNAAAVSMNTNQAFVDMASKIQAPVQVTPQANVYTSTNTNTNTNIRTADSHNIDNTRLSGTGVIGSGRYSNQEMTTTLTSTDTHTTTDSHNTTVPVPVPVAQPVTQ